VNWVVGPFGGTGLVPALDSLQTIFIKLRAALPELNDIMSTAIDITISAILAPLNAQRIPHGLLLLYPFSTGKVALGSWYQWPHRPDVLWARH
jgi:hypothetical protein